ncbi:MAG TPA: protoheme IX farnesyltransferase [Elusimicrobia bacterium]|nr:protoheme IX farnesyltransferase [Elusimicrobiota bacterium]
MRARLGAVVELIKPRIVTLSTLSSLAGILAAGKSAPWLALTAGVWLTAAGACALNQFQECDSDRLMRRTSGRPIPSGRLSAAAALAVSLALSAAGLAVLFAGCGAASCLLAACGAFWYNGVYTPLKTRSAFSAVIGAVTGAISPAIGWAATGRPLCDGALLALCFFFLIWQVPHSWLLSMRLSSEYEGAGFSTPVTVFGPTRSGRVLFCWMAVTALACLLLPLYGVVKAPLAVALLTAGAAWTTLVSVRLLAAGTDNASMRRAFGVVNSLALIVMAAAFLDRVL